MASRIPVKDINALITQTLQLTEQTPLYNKQAQKPYDPLFKTIAASMKRLAESLDSYVRGEYLPSWKLQYLQSEISEVAAQMERAKDLKKELPPLIQKVRMTVNNLFRTLHPSSEQASLFLLEGSHPVVERARQEAPADCKRTWQILCHLMQKNDPEVVASIMATENPFRLQSPQIMEIWSWAGGRFQVLRGILNIFWVPPKQLENTIARALTEGQFGVIAQPVIVHHFGRLQPILQEKVQKWAAQQFTPTVTPTVSLLPTLKALSSRLMDFLVNNKLLNGRPEIMASSPEEERQILVLHLDLFFACLEQSDFKIEKDVTTACQLWQKISEPLKQTPPSSSALSQLQEVLCLVQSFPDYIVVEDGDIDYRSEANPIPRLIEALQKATEAQSLLTINQIFSQLREHISKATVENLVIMTSLATRFPEGELPGMIKAECGGTVSDDQMRHTIATFYEGLAMISHALVSLSAKSDPTAVVLAPKTARSPSIISEIEEEIAKQNWDGVQRIVNQFFTCNPSTQMIQKIAQCLGQTPPNVLEELKMMLAMQLAD